MRAALRFVRRQLRARPLACFAVAFLLGMTLRRALPVPTVLCAAVLIALVASGYALRGRRGACAVLLLAAGFATGMTRMGLALDAARPVETQYSVEMTGRVASEPFTNPDTKRRICRFRVETVNGKPSSLTLRLYLRGEEPPLESVVYGQRLNLTGHIWAADPVTNPYQFDFGAYLRRQGMDAYATAKIEDVAVLDTTRDVQSWIVDARSAVARRIDELFPNNAGLVRALTLGDRSLLSDELRESLKQSGTAHLISISGMHVTVLSMLLAFVLGRFLSRRWANLIAVALLIPYGALIGFSAPFFRALTTFAILSFAPIAGHPSDSITRLCAAMLLWLTIRPLSLGDAGFALTFSASAGILLLTPPLLRLTGVEALKRKKPSPSPAKRALHAAAVYVPSLLCASLAAQLATLPFVIAFFGVQSVVSVPFNLLCVPLCMLGYILSLIALLLSALSVPLGAALAVLPDGLFTLMLDITRFSLRLPLASVRIGRYPLALLLVHWAILLAASDLSRIRFGFRRLLPLGLVGVAALSTLLVFLASWDYSVVFLDAGQADCAVVRYRGHTFLMDAGDTYTPAADYLNATCLHLDGVLLTHPHQDHAGGLGKILDSFRPDVVYLPKGWFEVEEVSEDITEGIEAAQGMGIPLRELCAGDSVQLPGGARMDIYSPGPGALPAEVNDMSLLALFTFDDQKALFTGDLSAEGEPDIIPDTDLLKTPHHGSNKATSQRLLDACTPEIAVISVGENNYGHPGDETVERLIDSGARVYQTRQWGAITATFRGGSWRVKTFLEVPNEVE